MATFQALGTYVYVGTESHSEEQLAEGIARRLLDEVDAACSRFRPDSDLTAVNRRPGTWVPVAPCLLAAVETAVDAAASSGGLVHPLLGRPLVQLGYDRDFAELVEYPDEIEVAPPGPQSWQQIGIDRSWGRIRIPADTALDLGATGKAFAADLIATAFQSSLSGAAVISVGGDLRVLRAETAPWPIAISTRPGEPAEETVALGSGGLATSSTQVRRWHRAGARRHHLLDPRTGLPVEEYWTTVTATGPSAVAANVAATAALVLGPAAPAWLHERAVTARLVGTDGSVRRTGCWPQEPVR